MWAFFSEGHVQGCRVESTKRFASKCYEVLLSHCCKLQCTCCDIFASVERCSLVTSRTTITILRSSRTCEKARCAKTRLCNFDAKKEKAANVLFASV